MGRNTQELIRSLPERIKETLSTNLHKLLRSQTIKLNDGRLNELKHCDSRQSAWEPRVDKYLWHFNVMGKDQSG